MSISTSFHYFLGANSYSGFASLYESLNDTNALDMLYILKGGAGCGKSSFMKRIAKRLEDAGLTVEYILCSGDPDSLDGIIIPQLRIAYVDGTAPHVIEPQYPAVAAVYINLGEYYNVKALANRRSAIISKTQEIKACYKKAYANLAAAGELAFPDLMTDDIRTTLKKRAKGIISREIKKRGGIGTITCRFVSSLTCKGPISRYDTVTNMCKRIYVLDNRFGFASVLFEEVAKAVSGYDLILCLSPLDPSAASHLIIPELSLAFIGADPVFPYEGEVYRHLRLDSLADKNTLADLRTEMRMTAKLHSLLLSEAQKRLFEAKIIHDELEALYNPFVDFASVHSLAEENARLLISRYVAGT